MNVRIYVHMYTYDSGTSNSGLSQIRTQYNKPLYKGHGLRFQYNFYIHFEPPKEEHISIKNKSAEFMLSSKCPIFGGSTVRNMHIGISLQSILRETENTTEDWEIIIRKHSTILINKHIRLG